MFGLTFLKYLLEMKGIFSLPELVDNENLETRSSYKAQLDPRVTPLFKQLCEKLVLFERNKYRKHQCKRVYLHGLLYASIAANPKLPQLLSVFFFESELNVQIILGKLSLLS